MAAAPVAKQSGNIIDRLHELPTLPAIVYELSKVIGDPMSSTTDVEAVMANDQSLTTKVLKLANSAYYAIPGGVSTLHRAVAFIGYDTIHQLVLSASIIKALDVKGPKLFDLNAFWKHSLGVAMASEVIAKKIHYPNSSDLFTCGLIHDMGKVAMYILASETFMAVVEHAEKNSVSFSEAEIVVGPPMHTEIGAALAGKWLLPPHIIAVTRYHHQKDLEQRIGVSSELNLVCDVVLLANLLIHALDFGNSGHKKITGVPKSVTERLNLGGDALKAAVEEIKVTLTNADSFLKIIGD